MRFAGDNISFGRHETFPLRYSWLTKGYQALIKNPKIFESQDATVTLRAGKNMAHAIRYWLQAAQIVKRIPKGFVLTSIGIQCHYLVIDFMTSLSKIDSLTRQPIPFAPTVLRTRPCPTPRWFAGQEHSHNDSTPPIAIFHVLHPSGRAFRTPKMKNSGVYRGLLASASLSMARSV